MKVQPIRKAVFPVAGLGTRFLPATKANPKEMLPIVDKPLIQYAVEEAVAAGAELLIFVTGRNKRAIEDHFDRAPELEETLERNSRFEQLKLVQDILPAHVACIHIRQAEALGLGDAVSCAEAVIGDEPFFVILADDLIAGDGEYCLQQMVAAYRENPGSILAVQRVDPALTASYGILETEPAEGRLRHVRAMVEKPQPEDAPSNLAVVGRYILTPKVLERLHGLGRGAGGEIQLTDAIASVLGEEPVYSYEFQGIRYDCGSKLGYLKATVAFALQHPELAGPFAEWLDTGHLPPSPMNGGSGAKV
ncbi:MAG TPA: UTP--glucose-1-phosphate uridylyltransferase GalU [Gammaproteobacteria bacterium]|nr:UTP--glucose-1-phosphate uridylyltransferase GalU [Gammaproteobacteria bacterium]